MRYLIFLLICGITLCQAQENDLVIRLRSVAHPLDFTESNFCEVEPILTDMKIVALGEGTHGTREFNELYSNLIRYCVEHLGHTAIAFEADFIACQAINEYITNKVDSIDYSRAFSFPMDEDKRKVFDWIRNWNAGLAPDHSKVEIFGMEIRNLRNGAKYLVDRLSVLGIDTAAIAPFIEGNVSQLDRKVRKEGVGFLRQLLKQEGTLIDENDHLLITMVIQNINYQQRLRRVFNHLNFAIGMRDRYMFENTDWILENTPHEKLIIWAHSGHVAKSRLLSAVPMGKYLYDKYENKYVAIGSTFGSGYVNLFVKMDGEYQFGKKYFKMPADNEFYEYYFDKVYPSTFFINLKAVKDDVILRDFFDETKKIRIIGGTAEAEEARRVRLSRLFDVVIYVPNSSLIVEN